MKIAFIIPYFGKFKNYFQLFLNSCASNAEVDWLIFTDNKDQYIYPSNVKVFHTTFKDIQMRFQSKFDFKISLEYPYKLCDYRPSYGYVFDDYLQEYDAWGYCDTDLIWGEFSKFITPELLNQYDKVGDQGHCTIINNTSINNKAFMLPINGKHIYKDVFTVNYNNSFDEEYTNSINNIFQDYGLKIYPSIKFMANIYTKSSDFRLTYMNNAHDYQVEQRMKNIFVWNKGSLKRYIKQSDIVEMNDYLYLHLQSRNMKITTRDFSRFKIIPNSFDSVETYEITSTDFPKWKHHSLHYFRLRSHNLIDKIKKHFS